MGLYVDAHACAFPRSPSHALQEVLLWLTNLQKELGQEVSDEKLQDFIWNTLNSGRVSSLGRELPP